MNDPKPCRICGAVLPLSEFYASKQHSDGHQSMCRACMAEKNRRSREKHGHKWKAAHKAYRKANKDRIREANARWRSDPAHREENRLRCAEWRKHNKSVPTKEAKEKSKARARQKYKEDTAYREQCKAYSQNYRVENKEKVAKALKKWAGENRKYTRAYMREWLKTEKGRELQKRLRERHSVARKAAYAVYRGKRMGAPGEITNDDINRMHHEQNHRCYYCHERFRGNWTVEHVRPLSRGGSNERSNVALACATCNFSKSDRLYPTEWTPREKPAL